MFRLSIHQEHTSINDIPFLYLEIAGEKDFNPVQTALIPEYDERNDQYMVFISKGLLNLSIEAGVQYPQLFSVILCYSRFQTAFETELLTSEIWKLIDKKSLLENTLTSYDRLYNFRWLATLKVDEVLDFYGNLYSCIPTLPLQITQVIWKSLSKNN